MASVTKNENSMAEEKEDDRAEDDREAREPSVVVRAATVERGGFFHIYKPGQGYWTRMGTVAGAGLIILLIGHFFYMNLAAWFPNALGKHGGILIGIVAAIIVGLSIVAFYLMNKPFNADFLIATDSEMKKVNWTSRRELIGSTKIVIIFVLLISLILFMIDVLFGYFFWAIDVLKQKPF